MNQPKDVLCHWILELIFRSSNIKRQNLLFIFCQFKAKNAYRIRVIAAPLLNWAPGNVKSLVFGVFLEYTPTFCLKSPLFGGFFELTPTQKPILKNRTPGLQWRGYGIYVCILIMILILKYFSRSQILIIKLAPTS